MFQSTWASSDVATVNKPDKSITNRSIQTSAIIKKDFLVFTVMFQFTINIHINRVNTGKKNKVGEPQNRLLIWDDLILITCQNVQTITSNKVWIIYVVWRSRHTGTFIVHDRNMQGWFTAQESKEEFQIWQLILIGMIEECVCGNLVTVPHFRVIMQIENGTSSCVWKTCIGAHSWREAPVLCHAWPSKQLSGAFLCAYRSHARVSHWVITRVCGLCFVAWFWISLRSAASHWTINSCRDLTCYSVFLSWSRLCLSGFCKWRSYSDAGNWTLHFFEYWTFDFFKAAWCGRNWIGPWKIKKLYRSSLVQPCSAQRSSTKVTIQYREFADQVFNAATSVQVWNVGKTCRQFLLGRSPGLMCLVLIGGLVRWCRLKEGEHNNKSPKTLLIGSERCWWHGRPSKLMKHLRP